MWQILWSQRVRVCLKANSAFRLRLGRELTGYEARRIFDAAALTALLGLCPGCGGGPWNGPGAGRITAGDTSPGRALLTADWNDLDAAADVAVGRAQLAIVSTMSPDPCTRRYELTTVRGEPGALTITRPPPCEGPGESIPLTIEAAIGRFGDPERERTLLSAFTSRLADLHGVEFAPVR